MNGRGRGSEGNQSDSWSASVDQKSKKRWAKINQDDEEEVAIVRNRVDRLTNDLNWAPNDASARTERETFFCGRRRKGRQMMITAKKKTRCSRNGKGKEREERKISESKRNDDGRAQYSEDWPRKRRQSHLMGAGEDKMKDDDEEEDNKQVRWTTRPA